MIVTGPRWRCLHTVFCAETHLYQILSSYGPPYGGPRPVPAAEITLDEVFTSSGSSYGGARLTPKASSTSLSVIASARRREKLNRPDWTLICPYELHMRPAIRELGGDDDTYRQYHEDDHLHQGNAAFPSLTRHVRSLSLNMLSQRLYQVLEAAPSW